MQYEAQCNELFHSQRWKSPGTDWQDIRGVAGLAARHLELRDVRDILNRCGLALVSEKARERLPLMKPARRRRSFADDESTRHRIKRLVPDDAPGDGKPRGQAVDRAAISPQPVICATTSRAVSPQPRPRIEAGSRDRRLDVHSGTHSSILG